MQEVGGHGGITTQEGWILDNENYYVSYFLLHVRGARVDHYWLNSITLNVVSFLPPPPRYLVFGFFK